VSVADLRIGTRASKLALWQAYFVRDALESAGFSTEVIEITTTGDNVLDIPLYQIGVKALFTKELDVALLDGRIDLAVHSLKDLPTILPEGVALAAVCEREDPSDAFVAHPDFTGILADLPPGATLATSSLRRGAQLLAWRSDLHVVPVRGNVLTRLEKLDSSEWHGMILASAGLIRLDLAERIRERVPESIMLPAVSQGALGIVCREGDRDTAHALRQHLHHEDTASATTAERAFLRRLEGGCSVPVGSHAIVEDGILRMDGCVAALDGSRLLRDEISGNAVDAARIGTDLAERLIADGAGDILSTIRPKGSAS
jgi:hydroxymethylbilane synthase